MRPIIKVENLGKQYGSGGLHPAYMTFREAAAAAMVKPFRRVRRRGTQPATEERLWALKDVSFEIEPGEVVGLIGDNGAGKSTLLKILSRIVEPTTGTFELYGRIGSLLEVGTGFHPDLSGRENIFLNGALLGIKRAELQRRFDEIVAFSEIEQFIDLPVKWYSSGMYLRLAFSVAAHLNTEILTMDEVLAVGDISFQQKCIDKVNEIREQGRTILFVSHSMAAVTRLCERVILLDKGRVVKDGAALEVVNDYMGESLNVTTAVREWPDPQSAPGNEVVRIRRVRVRTKEGDTASQVDIRNPVGIEMTYEVLQPDQILTPSFDLFNEQGVHVFAVHDVGLEWRREPRPVGRYVSTMWIPGNTLSEGRLLVQASVLSYHPGLRLHTREPNVVTFQVVESAEGESARGDYVGAVPGVVRPLLPWQTDFYRTTDIAPNRGKGLPGV
ncbi:MAG TPA: ABC transporter ATP-binding protein [Pyrinomonadaceae bacterium]|nr:ABC transporter ATP-binding protein [Pyrinomonadaceae bacterium]